MTPTPGSRRPTPTPTTRVWSHTTVNTSPGTPVTITLQAWDAELDSLNWVIVNTVGGTTAFAPSPSNVADSLGYSTMDVVFTPNAGFSGVASIEFSVNDGANTSNTASVDINVGGTGGTTTSVSAPALSWPGAAALVFGMLGLVLVFLIRNRSRSPG